MNIKNTFTAKLPKSGRAGAIALGVDIDTLRLNVLIIDLLILVIIGLAVQVA
jgi:hypothetical protein